MLRLGPDRATLKIHLSRYMAEILIGKGSLDRSWPQVSRLVWKVVLGGGGSYDFFFENLRYHPTPKKISGFDLGGFGVPPSPPMGRIDPKMVRLGREPPQLSNKPSFVYLRQKKLSNCMKNLKKLR